jgi:DNA-3-methyladenine glycosylase I
MIPRGAQARCSWAKSPAMIEYHDREWGVPTRDDGTLFEFLILEGAQAGLSWETILNKRERYREVFAGFDPEKVARFTPARVEKLLLDPGIVRNRLKVAGAVKNAKAFLAVQREFGSFANYAWAFVENAPIVNKPRGPGQVPATSAVSDALAKDLKKRGFTFVGSTIIYAFMQAVGIVDDHMIGCVRDARTPR